MATSRWEKIASAVSSVGSAITPNQIVDANFFVNRPVETSHAFDGHAFSRGMRIDDQCIATGNHAYGVASDGRQRMRNRCNRPDDTKRCMFDDGQAMIAAKYLALQELDAGCFFAERAQLFDSCGPSDRFSSLPFPSCPTRPIDRWRCDE